MPVFVKASRRAKAYIRGSRSKIGGQAKLLGLSKISLVKSHAYRNVKNLDTYGGGIKSKIHHTKRLETLEKAMRNRGLDPHNPYGHPSTMSSARRKAMFGI